MIQLKSKIWTLGALVAGMVWTSSLMSCKTVDEQVADFTENKDHSDPHTYSNYNSIKTTHLNLDLQVDFATKTLNGSAEWTIERTDKDEDRIIFDTHELHVDSVILDNGENALYHMGKTDPILGSPLTVKLEANTQKVKIYYSTSEHATALQWLDTLQTSDKKTPFLYTQGESIYSRTWIPCQDAPAVRFSYEATIQAPKNLLAVMSASNPKVKNETGIYHFKMEQKIPAYLIALAIGDLKFKSITPNIGVYAEPSQLDKAYAEVADLGKMMEAAESLYGQYAWGRYDVLFLPIGFPFGGMENPRLTFATPTILTGDKSLVNLIAHELAHSWSGNLVTNATWNDFWLNESFTVYFERRIMEAVEGKEFAAMLWDLGLQDLLNSLKKYKDNNELYLSKLKLDLKGKDPDLGLTDFAYEKGAAMLLLMEQTIGRPALDSFIQTYFQTHQFTSVFTSNFDEYITKTLFKDKPELRQQIKFDEWLYEEGLPDNCPKIANPKFAIVDTWIKNWRKDETLPSLEEANWSTYEWLHFLRGIQPHLKHAAQLAAIDSLYQLSQSPNAEIATQWYVIAIEQQYEPAFEPMERFLKFTGRMKFLEPIYEALAKQSDYKPLAKQMFEMNKVNYHPLAQKSVAQIIQ